ncbi:hypothetical protein RJ641_011254 [Dillenia turbinata]|uniref:Uncharacterized protein n=1 Tax=Dillenia turbinata TaxID=194707 RepID=A0AAN8Z543_9MAGN
MADIAILVAEEYERRIKNARRSGAQEEIDLVSYVSVWVKRIDGSASSWLKTKFGDDKIETVKWILDPKTEIGLAASSGLFSA